MADKDFTQITIQGIRVGITGLKATVEEMASAYAQKPDEDVAAELIKRIEAGNYIPSKARGAYGKALVREFRKIMGQPFEEEAPVNLQIRVLGPGCYNCTKLENNVRDVLAELDIAADLIHVTDMQEIGRYGVMGVPALVINEKVVFVGSVPPKSKIKQWLQSS